MRIGAVVLHYRSWPGIQATLERVLDQGRVPDDVILVDNCSNDGSVDRIRAAFPQLEIFELERNGGYAAGMNAGIRTLLAKGTDAMLLLTHDCELQSDALGILADRLDARSDLGAVGPLLGFSSSPDRVFSAGGFVDHETWTIGHRRIPERMEEWRGLAPHEVEWLDGAAILLRGDAVRDAGPLPTSYFLYLEDCDYALGLRRRGWKIECVPAAVAWQEPRMRTLPTDYFIRNRLRFLARNAPRERLRHELSAWVLPAIKGVIRRPHHTWRIVAPPVRAIIAFAFGNAGPPRNRNRHLPEEAAEVQSAPDRLPA